MVAGEPLTLPGGHRAVGTGISQPNSRENLC